MVLDSESCYRSAIDYRRGAGGRGRVGEVMRGGCNGEGVGGMVRDGWKGEGVG